MAKNITVNLPADLPENWTDTQYVSPEGIEVGLTEKHGYNYLMKQVNNAQKAVVELANAPSAAHDNLLDNWDFRYAVDTKQGYLVPAGTSYFEDPQLTTTAGSVPANTYWTAIPYSTDIVAFPNENAESRKDAWFYVQSSSCIRGYLAQSSEIVCLNRWRTVGNGSSPGTVRTHIDGVQISFPASGSFYQKARQEVLTTLGGDRKVTLSVDVVSMSGGTVTLRLMNGTSTLAALNISATGISSVTATVPQNVVDLRAGLYVTGSTAATIKVSRMKLEVGETSTLSEDGPVNRAEQYSRCAQYDATKDTYIAMPFASTANEYVHAEMQTV